MILGKKSFPLIRGLDFFGEKIFFDHVTFFVTHTLFVILDILDNPDEFGEKIFFDHVTFFVTHNLFVILDILDIHDEFGEIFFFITKGQRVWNYYVKIFLQEHFSGFSS